MASTLRRLSSASLASISSLGSGKKPKRRSKTRKRTQSMPAMSVNLDLDGNALTLTEDGMWVLEHGTRSDPREVQQLEQKVSGLEFERAELKRKLSAVEAERTLAEFKIKILLEMLACTELDAENNHEKFQRESLKAEALKWKLSEQLMTK